MISTFLLGHRHQIESASLVADRLILEVKADLPMHEVFILFADLINECQPTRAVLMDPRRIRLEFA